MSRLIPDDKAYMEPQICDKLSQLPKKLAGKLPNPKELEDEILRELKK